MDNELIESIMTRISESESDWECQGTQTERQSQLENLEFTRDERRLVKGIVEDTGKELLQWLLDTGFLSQRIPDNWSWDTIIGKFCIDTGLTRTTKCYECKSRAIEVSKGKFHCEECGRMFDEDVCPVCGEEMDLGEPTEGEKFTPFYVCPKGHFHTEAPG